MKVHHGIHLIIDFKSEVQLKSDLADLKDMRAGQSAIWLKGEPELLNENAVFIRDIFTLNDLPFLIEGTPQLAKHLHACGILLNNARTIPSVKSSHPELSIGLIAGDLAECKNGELLGADFVCLGPYDQLGVSPYHAISPKKQEYEWVILNIIIPLFAYGNFTPKSLSELSLNVKLGGIAIEKEDIKLILDNNITFNE